jgi:hypothetical protein
MKECGRPVERGQGIPAREVARAPAIADGNPSAQRRVHLARDRPVLGDHDGLPPLGDEVRNGLFQEVSARAPGVEVVHEIVPRHVE